MIAVSGVAGGVVTVSGASGASEPGTTILVTNLRTGATVITQADINGAFSAQLAALEGDSLRVQVVDAAGNASGSIELSTGSIRVVC